MTQRTSGLPAMNLQPVYQTLRHPLRIPLGGAWVVLLAAAASLLVSHWRVERYQATQPREILYGQLGTRDTRRLTPHEQRLKRLFEQLDAPVPDPEPPHDPTPQENPAASTALRPVPEGHVRVAAIQFHPAFNQPELNRQRLVRAIRSAAEKKATLVVLPEGAIPGIAEMNTEIFWSAKPLNSKAEKEDFRPVQPVLESKNGPSVRLFAELADRLDLYLTLPFFEVEGEQRFSTVMLLGPDGKVLLHTRKLLPVKPADSAWMDPGDLGAPVVATPLGRIGVMISYDGPKALPQLNKAKPDLLLWCAALRGNNIERSIRRHIAQSIRENGAAVILANWTYPDAWWNGHGYSHIVDGSGRRLNHATQPEDDSLRETILIADLPLPEAAGR